MNKLLLFILLFPVWFSSVQAAPAQASEPVVQAILFYSPTCGHCEYVITEVLPPLIDQYGDQLQIIGVDISSESGQTLFMLTLQEFGLESGGVPFLVVGDTYLVGSLDIPEKFPELVEELLAQGGVDWPDIPGIDQVLASANIEAPGADVTSQADALPTAGVSEEQVMAATDSDLSARLARDPDGNTLAIIVLVGMVASAAWVGLNYRRIKTASLPESWKWAVPVLCVIGLGVAGYLAYVETAHVEAVCGPVGDCNTVQQSKYAVLFGVLPVGVLGIVGNAAILVAWVINRYGKKEWSTYAAAAMFGMATFGLLFSIYLTFLEPFVIGATCAWCLSSAVIMTALFWLSLSEGKKAINTLFGKQQPATKTPSPALQRRRN